MGWLCVELGVRAQEEGFAEFYRRFKDDCLLTVLVSVRDDEAAEELVAEAFARAWARWATVAEHPAPQGWVVRTALNTGVSRWRRRRREVTVADPATLSNPPVVARASEILDPTIMAAVMRLPPRQRQVVALRLLLDLDTVRSAEVLGIATGTVQAHLGRAIATLRTQLSCNLWQETLA